MSYDHIPAEYQPPAIRERAAQIDALMIAALGARHFAEDYDLKWVDQRGADLQKAQDQAAADLVALIAERRDNETRAVRKAGYMVESARNVALQEAAEATSFEPMGAIRQAISDLGLQYFIERPETLLAAIDNPTYPEALDFL